MADLGKITEAVAIKIQEVFGPIIGSDIINRDIICCPEEIAPRQRAEATAGSNKPAKQDKTKYTFEFINFWMTSCSFSWERQRSPLARTGLNIGTSNSKLRMVKAVPVDIEYTISLWTLHKQRADDFIKEYCFLQHSNPNLDFYWEGDKKFEINFMIKPSVRTDDSVSKMYVEGKYWKPQITFQVEGWLIKDVPINYAKTVNLDIYSSNNLEQQASIVKVFHEQVEA